MQAALKQATEELQETQRVLAEAKARLAEVEEGIASLQAKYEECIAKKQELEFKTEQCSARLDRAEKVSLIDDIRIPRRPWDERLHSMIARLKRGTFWQKHKQTFNKHWLVEAESLQNDINQQKTARFKS